MPSSRLSVSLIVTASSRPEQSVELAHERFSVIILCCHARCKCLVALVYGSKVDGVPPVSTVMLSFFPGLSQSRKSGVK